MAPGGEEQRAVVKLAAATQGDCLGFGREGYGGVAEEEFDVQGPVIVGGPQGDPLLRRVSGEVVLGEIGAIDRAGFFVAYEGDGSGVALGSKCFDTGGAGGAGADHHHGGGRLRRGGRRGQIEFPSDTDVAGVVLDGVTGQRREGGCSERLTGLEAETGVVPRAADGVVDDESFGERSAVVGAGGAQGEQAIAPANENDGFLVDLSEERHAVRQQRGRNSGFQIGQIRHGTAPLAPRGRALERVYEVLRPPCQPLSLFRRSSRVPDAEDPDVLVLAPRMSLVWARKDGPGFDCLQ